MSTTTEIMTRLDRLTAALERQQGSGGSPRSTADDRRPLTFGEQVRHRAAEPCQHGEPRGSSACPLCRRRGGAA